MAQIAYNTAPAANTKLAPLEVSHGIQIDPLRKELQDQHQLRTTSAPSGKNSSTIFDEIYSSTKCA